MARRYSESSPLSNSSPDNSGKKDPKVFIVSGDNSFLDSVLDECATVPPQYTVVSSIEALRDALARMEKVNLAFVLIVERSGDMVDVPALRSCKLDYPQLFFVVILEECEQRTALRLQSVGVHNILLPPYAHVDISKEIATALPNVPHFKRHPDLLKFGQLRLDFLIPSDLAFGLGMNYLLSMLLKEFAFPLADSRINIPLACDEAITNAIIHGNNKNPEKKVGLQIYMSHSRFKIRVTDQGEGFDLDSIENPTSGEALMRSSGRGIYLMKSIMDRVEYKEGGRVVELEKSNPAANKS